MSKKKFRVLADQEIDGIKYKANDVVLLEEKTGKAYDSLDGDSDAVDYCLKELKCKAIDHASNCKQNESDVSMEDIIEAINLLDDDNDDHWTSDNKPQVKALEEILGKDITADQRDEAFKLIN